MLNLTRLWLLNAHLRNGKDAAEREITVNKSMIPSNTINIFVGFPMYFLLCIFYFVITHSILLLPLL